MKVENVHSDLTNVNYQQKNYIRLAINPSISSSNRPTFGAEILWYSHFKMCILLFGLIDAGICV